jgi:CRP-like cAMP-binding protein
MEIKKVRKDEIICQEGTAGDVMYIIQSGTAEVFKKINNEVVKLTMLSKGDFFGEISLMLSIPRTASIKALENSQVQALDKNEFLEKMRKEPAFLEKLLYSQSQRLIESHNVISRLKGEKDSFKLMYGAK